MYSNSCKRGSMISFLPSHHWMSRNSPKKEEVLSAADEEMYRDAERLKNIVWDYAASEGRGKVLWPLRYALSGREKSPDPFLIASVIGRERVLARIAAAKILLAV